MKNNDKLVFKYKKNDKSLVVGLTGGIGTGKTTVSNELKKLGAFVIDSDKISKNVVKSGSVGLKKIVKAFGKEILKSNSSLNRKKLAEIVFNDSPKLRVLENIVHPLVIKEINSRISGCLAKKKGCIIVIDVPLLFETGLNKYVDKVVVVWTSKNMQVKRLEKRGVDKKESALRIKHQMSLLDKRKHADYVLDNSLTIGVTKKSVKKLWGSLNQSPDKEFANNSQKSA